MLIKEYIVDENKMSKTSEEVELNEGLAAIFVVASVMKEVDDEVKPVSFTCSQVLKTVQCIG